MTETRTGKAKSMLTRILSVLFFAMVATGYLAVVMATVMLAAAAPAIAERSSATLEIAR
jgi:hypothetical protein